MTEAVSSEGLSQRPIHLGPGGAAGFEPDFSGTVDWYEEYAARHHGEGAEGRLVSMFTFDTAWDFWEMHPLGHEVVVCTAGSVVLHQEFPDGRTASVVLTAGNAVINDPGVWHTADVPDGPATALFITAGAGTQHRPR